MKNTLQAPCDCYTDDNRLMACSLHAQTDAMRDILARIVYSVAPDRFGDGYPSWYPEARDILRAVEAILRAAEGEES